MTGPRVATMTPPVERRRARARTPCALVVFGAGGDLTRRKLLPALYNLALNDALPERFSLVGVARRPMSADAFRAMMREAVAEFSRRPLVDERWEPFAGTLEYVPGEFADPATYERLGQRLVALDRERGLEGNRIFYLATPPSEFGTILQALNRAGLIRKGAREPFTRVIIEKPFGHDLESARALNHLAAELLDEHQTFRIDHYLGKETVQNILVFRFANSMFEPLWNRKYVEFVEIVAAEDVGVESRGRFYDQTGVLRDIVQNHLLEILSLTAMEPPTTGEPEDIRGEKHKVLDALRDPDPRTLTDDVVLGQYRGYREEDGVAPDSTMPTFAALRVFVDNWRWQGVPFYLRAGKKLAKRVTEVSVHMQPIPLSLFGRNGVRETLRPNVLTLRIQPDEGIQLEFASKIPGDSLQVGAVKMDMSYTETFGGEPPEAYERLLLDAMRGDLTLFLRRDWVEMAWAWIDPIVRHYEQHPPRDLPNYEPGSWGPKCCDEWMAKDRRTWRQL